MVNFNSYNPGKTASIIYMIFLLGLTGYAASFLRPLALTITPFGITAAVLAAVYEPIKNNRSLLVWIILVYFITVTLEIIGTNTGIVFGNFHYGNTLGPKIMNVPYIVGLNWVMIILGTNAVAYILSKGRYFRWVIASCLLVITFYFGENPAAELDYWSWLGNYIPLKNYASCFLIAFAASAALSLGVKNYFHKNFLQFYLGLAVLILLLHIIL